MIGKTNAPVILISLIAAIFLYAIDQTDNVTFLLAPILSLTIQAGNLLVFQQESNGDLKSSAILKTAFAIANFVSPCIYSFLSYESHQPEALAFIVAVSRTAIILVIIWRLNLRYRKNFEITSSEIYKIYTNKLDGAWYFISGLAAPALVYIDRAVIKLLGSDIELGRYALIADFCIRTVIFASAYATSKLHALRTTHFNKSIPELANRVKRQTYAIILGTAPMYLVFSAGTSFVLQYLLGNKFDGRDEISFNLLLAAMWINSAAQAPFIVLQMIGKIGVITKSYLFQLAMFSTFQVFLYQNYGLVGVCLSQLLRTAFDYCIMHVALNKYYAQHTNTSF